MPQPLPPTVLSLLNASDAAARDHAWTAFLREYNKLILHVCHHFGGDYDAVMDRYAFAVEHLQRNESKWLTAYDVNGRGKFTTWFVVVLRRICLDERRKRYGRRQADTQAAQEQDRARRDLADLVAAELDSVQIADSARLPDASAAAAEMRERLAGALATLCAEDRLLLRFRFEQELSVPEIGRLTGAESPFHVYRRIDKLLGALREELGQAGLNLDEIIG